MLQRPSTDGPTNSLATNQNMRMGSALGAGFWLSIILNAVAPYVLYQYLTAHNMPIIEALSLTAIFPVIGTLVGFARTRHADVIGVATLVLIVIGLLTTVIFSNPGVYLIKESFVTGALGVACLLSLVVLPRPAMFYVGRYFFSRGNAGSAQEFSARWQYPYFRYAQRLITAVWGIAYLAEALIRVALVHFIGTSKQGVSEILAISPLLLGGVTVLTLVWMFWYIRHSVAKAMRIRAQHAAISMDTGNGANL